MIRTWWIETKSFSSEIFAAYEERPDELTFRIAKDVTQVVALDDVMPALLTLKDLQDRVDDLCIMDPANIAKDINKVLYRFRHLLEEWKGE